MLVFLSFSPSNMSTLLRACFSKPVGDLKNLRRRTQCLIVSNLYTGQSVEVKRIVTPNDLQQFIDLSGDNNEVHTSNKGSPPIVHGALLNGLVSGVIGTKLPGHGTLLLEQTLRFPNPCYVNEEITIQVTIEGAKKIVLCSFICTVIDDKMKSTKTVLTGTAKLYLKP